MFTSLAQNSFDSVQTFPFVCGSIRLSHMTTAAAAPARKASGNNRGKPLSNSPATYSTMEIKCVLL